MVRLEEYGDFIQPKRSLHGNVEQTEDAATATTGTGVCTRDSQETQQDSDPDRKSVEEIFRRDFLRSHFAQSTNSLPDLSVERTGDRTPWELGKMPAAYRVTDPAAFTGRVGGPEARLKLGWADGTALLPAAVHHVIDVDGHQQRWDWLAEGKGAGSHTPEGR